MMINDYKKVTVQVPASSANLGPGFDAIGLAIDYWNQATFELVDSGYQVEAEGESAALVPKDENNYIVQSFFDLYRHLGEKIPPGLKVRCINQIPLASGMGSSTAALLTGLLGANALLGSPMDKFDLLNLATSIEGHPDNVSPALFGGLTIGCLKTGLRDLSVRTYTRGPQSHGCLARRHACAGGNAYGGSGSRWGDPAHSYLGGRGPGRTGRRGRGLA